MKTRAIIILILLLLLLLGYFVIKTRSVQSDLRIAELKLQDSTAFIELIDKYKKKYYEQEQVNATLKEAIESGEVEKADLKAKRLKDVQTIIRLQERAYMVNMITKYDTVYISDSVGCLRVPVGFSYSDEWVHLRGRVLLSEIVHDSISFFNDFELIVGEKKQGLKKLPVVTYESKNPYICVTGMKNIVIEPKQAFYNRLWFRAVECGVSFGLGYHFGSK